MLPPSLGEQLHDNVPDTATLVAPLDGDGDDGVVGAETVEEFVVVKLHVGLCVDLPLPLYAMSFQ